MALTKAKVSFVEGLDGAVLTGAMPAVDGSSLTGVAGMTKVTSNPLITTNPSDGVGALWVNKSSGEMFVCKDATTDANVWVNVGGGYEGVAKPFGGLGGGVAHGYSCAGYVAGNPASPGFPGSNVTSKIDKFSFTSDGNATGHGDLIAIGGELGRFGNAPSSSATDGFTFGGSARNPAWFTTNTINKFSFASNTTASAHGVLSLERNELAGCSSSTHGYSVGGQLHSNVKQNRIDKFAFSSNTTADDIGDTHHTTAYAVGCSSNTHGYVVGGSVSPITNRIERFSFASGTQNGSDQGDLTQAKQFGGRGGCSSESSGYISGGYLTGGTVVKVIEKFSFYSTVNSTQVGNLLGTNWYGTGSSSTTYGYWFGGTPNSNVIQKASFSSDGDSSDVGDLRQALGGSSGHQV